MFTCELVLGKTTFTFFSLTKSHAHFHFLIFQDVWHRAITLSTTSNWLMTKRKVFVSIGRGCLYLFYYNSKTFKKLFNGILHVIELLVDWLAYFAFRAKQERGKLKLLKLIISILLIMNNNDSESYIF